MSRRSAITSVVAATVWCAPIVGAGDRVPTLLAASVPQISQELPVREGADTVRARCTMCHGADLIVQQRLSREGWSREVEKMTAWGAVVAAGEQEAVLNYLAASFGVQSNRLAAEATSTGAALLQARCQTCHDLRLVEQQRLNADSWARELDKMIGWGAALTESEKNALIEHLARPMR